jgi:hypothetical protein
MERDDALHVAAKTRPRLDLRQNESSRLMKTVLPGLAQHLAGEVTTLATCWQITRRDARRA